MLDINSFKHNTELQIRYNDIDMAGHVNNAIHMYYYDYGRLKYFNRVFDGLIDWNDKGFVIVKTTMEYAKPIYLNDQIIVFTKISKIGNKSIEMIQAIYNQDRTLNSFNTSILVGFDYKNQFSIEIPDNWKKQISIFEKI